jgi:hypothetical protein
MYSSVLEVKCSLSIVDLPFSFSSSNSPIFAILPPVRKMKWDCRWGHSAPMGARASTYIWEGGTLGGARKAGTWSMSQMESGADPGWEPVMWTPTHLSAILLWHQPKSTCTPSPPAPIHLTKWIKGLLQKGCLILNVSIFSWPQAKSPSQSCFQVECFANVGKLAPVALWMSLSIRIPPFQGSCLQPRL